MISLSRKVVQSSFRQSHSKFAILKRSMPQTAPQSKRLNPKSVIQETIFQKSQKSKIDEINQHFLGVSLNTDYKSFYNEDSFNKCLEDKYSKISDLTFEGKKQFDHSKVKIGGETCRHIFFKINLEVLKTDLLMKAQQYFKDIVTHKRNVKVEPNFERMSHQTIASLRHSKYSVTQQKPEREAKLNILKVSLIKGVEVLRNNNYSSDSYGTTEQDRIIFYKLWQKNNEILEQKQFTKQQGMIMRFETQLINGSNIIIQQGSGSQVINTQQLVHDVVFEMDLRKPPKFSSFKLKQFEFLKAYRPDLESMYITNVDNKNPYFALTYSENQKKQLINKLI